MTDLQFHDVVSDINFEYDRERNRYRDEPKPSKCQALCSTCGTYHEVTVSELSLRCEQDVFQYVASMRAWNCCHEGVEPYDGFPEEPEYRFINCSDAETGD